MKKDKYIPPFEKKVEDFLDIMDYLRGIYYENFRLREENAKLRKVSQERFEQIMRMSRLSQQGLDNWMKAILEGKVKICNNDD